MDMVRHPYLKASPKRKVFGYRRSVPLELRPIVGTREIIHSFGTTDLDEARAAYHPYAAQVEARIALARTRLGAFDSAAPITASNAQLELCASFQAVTRGDASLRADAADCERHYRQYQQRERNFYKETQAHAKLDPGSFLRGDRFTTPSGRTFCCELTRAEMSAMPEFAWVEQNYGLGWWYAHLLSCRRRWSEVFERLDALARGMADVHTEGITSHLYAGQTMACILAERLAIRDLLAHPELQPLIVPNEDYGDAAQQTHPPAADHVGESEVVGQVYLSHAVQEWIDAHCRGESAWGVERRALCRVVLEQFIAACGDKSVSAYGKSDGRKFIALLRQLPPNLSKLPPRNGNLYATAAAAANRGLSPQNDRTVNKKIGIVNQCFRWIIAHYDECSTSPVDGMKLRIRQSVKEEREPFTGDQLYAMFHAPLYVGCRSELHWSQPGSCVLHASPKFWIPLIGLYSGMRLNEICQLTRSHIRVHEGICYFALTSDLRLKNAASIRSVPVHKTLIDLGFLQFVETCPGRLFPALRAHASGRLSDSFGKHFARFLQSLGIEGDKINFHSFRHNFAAAADACGMEFAARERIMGHTLQGQAARYGERYDKEQADMRLLNVRNKQLQKLSYPGLDLDHLPRSKANRE